jgi:hypothetical protein
MTDTPSSSSSPTPQGTYVSLITFRRDGREVATPVWFTETGGRLYVYTLADTGKMKRLAHTQRVRLAECSMRGEVKGAWMEGHAAILEHPGVIATAMAAFGRKYGWQFRLATLMSWLSGKLAKRRVVEITLGAV